MLAVSNNFKNSIKQGARQFKAIFIIHGEKYESSDKLLNFKIETASEIFGASMRKLSFKILDVRADFSEKMVKASFGVLVGENFEMMDLGEFFITEANINLETNTTEIIAYDKMIFMHKQFEPQLHNFPTTVQEFTAQIANVCNLELLGEIENGSLEVPTNYFEKSRITYRDILKQIAQLSGSICLVSGGKLVFRKLKTQKISETLTDSELRKFKFTGDFKPANVLVLSRTPQEDNVYFPNELPSEKHQIKIENNEFLDKRRIEAAERVFDTISGLNFSGVELSTIGLGYFEAGDRIAINAGGKQAESFIFSHTIEFNNGFKENIKTITPEAPITNFKRASNIIKRVYNTEIIVDKQKQEIASIVSDIATANGVSNEKFSRIDQNLHELKLSVQNAGGLNLIKNSVGYVGENGKFDFWAVAGKISASTSPESLRYGAISAHQFDFEKAGSLTQKVNVSNGQKYSLSFRAKKGLGGNAKISILDGSKKYELAIDDQSETLWSEKFINFVAENSEIMLKIETDKDVAHFGLTDLMLTTGENFQKWQQANGEVANSSVNLTENGLVVRNSRFKGDRIEITPIEFAGYSNASGSEQKVFHINRETTEVEKIKSRAEITMPPLKIMPFLGGNQQGWAIVPDEERRN